MKFTTVHRTRARAVPVILAGNPLHGLWPRSTPSHPYSLMPDRNGETPVGRLCALFGADSAFAPPLVIVSEQALDAATDAFVTCGADKARLIVVPADSRNGVSATLAAIAASKQDDDVPLLFVPATLDAPANRELAALFLSAAAIAVKTGKAVAFARRARAQERAICLTAGDRHPSGLRLAECALSPDGDAGEAAREMGALQALAGPVAVNARRFLDIVGDVQPTLLQGCANALALGDADGGVIRPHRGYLSLFAGAGIAELVAARPQELLLHPAGEAMRVVRSWLDLPAEATYAGGRRDPGRATGHGVANDDRRRAATGPAATTGPPPFRVNS